MTIAVERDLVGRAANRDPAATAALLAQVRPGIVRYCRARLGRIAGAYATADDVAQEVCIALLRALPGYTDQGRPFSAFVYAIAARKVVDAQRAASRDAVVTAVDRFSDRPDGARGPEEQAIAVDDARRMFSLLNLIPAAQREIVLLRVAFGLSAEEVAGILGMTAVAVRVAQSRALARLRTLARATLGEVSTP